MKKARCGRCKHCNAMAFHRCHRCGDWLCVFQGAPCGKLRKVAGEVGRYDLVCAPRCRKTRSDVGVPRGASARTVGDLSDFERTAR